jgi:dolichol-phosphate mannosyltransferase
LIKIIFCCLNEEENLPTLLAEIKKEMQTSSLDYQIISCIDGSNDKSEEILSEFFKNNAGYLLKNINQRGLGLSYKRLFLQVIKNSQSDDLIISLDADNTHKPLQIIDMIDHFKKNNLDLLIASRFCDSSFMKDFPLYRKLISLTTSFILTNVFKVRNIENNFIKDYTSGFRIYRTKKLIELYQKLGDNFIEEPEFTYTCELLIKMFMIKSRIDEIAINYDYGKKIGASKLRFFINLKRLMIMILRLKFKLKLTT